MKILSKMHISRLRTRIILTYTVLIVVGFGGLAWLAGGQIARAAQEDFAEAHLVQTELLAHGLIEDLEHYLRDTMSGDHLESHIQGFAMQLDMPIVLFDADGRAIFETDGTISPPEIQNGEIQNTAEVRNALAGNASYMLRKDDAGELTVFAAAPLLERDEVFGVVQTARPMTAANAAVRQRWVALAIGVSVLALLTVIASFWLATSLTRPLEALRGAALRLAAGDLNQRLPASRPDEIGQVSSAFNIMAKEVQTMIEEQRAFAANAAHELRTPLTTIRLRSEALRNETLGPELEHQYISEIDNEVTRLGGMVEDLSLLARLEAGRDVRGRDQIDVARMVRGMLREFELYPEAAGINLNLVAPADLPTLTASLNHLRVLLRNVLSNALAYTPTGGSITCTIAVQPLDEQAAQEAPTAPGKGLLFTVTDTGQGISADDLGHVTERFFRADKAHTRAVKGSGLGLTLVQSIVNCYGGHLEITSPGLGQGTSVRVWWPLSPVSDVPDRKE